MTWPAFGVSSSQSTSYWKDSTQLLKNGESVEIEVLLKFFNICVEIHFNTDLIKFQQNRVEMECWNSPWDVASQCCMSIFCTSFKMARVLSLKDWMNSQQQKKQQLKHFLWKAKMTPQGKIQQKPAASIMPVCFNNFTSASIKMIFWLFSFVSQ